MIIPWAEASSNERYFLVEHPRRRFRIWHRDGARWFVYRREANGEPIQFPRILAPQHQPPPADSDRAIAAEIQRILARSPR